MAKYEEFFNLNASEDEEDIRNICGTAIERLKSFNITFNDYRLLAAFFCKVYDALLTSLEKFEKEYSDFEINFCDRFVIGYSTSEDEDDEKQGNFMVYVRHIKADTKKYEFNDEELKTSERLASWVTDNLNDQPELITKIAGEAIKLLKDINIRISSTDCIITVFSVIYETIVNYLKAQRQNTNSYEYEINFMGCFYIGVRESEDGEGDVYIRPNIESKLRLKNDAVASSKYE